MTKGTATILSGLAILVMFAFSSAARAASVEDWSQWRGNGFANAKQAVRGYDQRNDHIVRESRLFERRDINFRPEQRAAYTFDKRATANRFQKNTVANRSRDPLVSRFKNDSFGDRFGADLEIRFNRWNA